MQIKIKNRFWMFCTHTIYTMRFNSMVICYLVTRKDCWWITQTKLPPFFTWLARALESIFRILNKFYLTYWQITVHGYTLPLVLSLTHIIRIQRFGPKPIRFWLKAIQLYTLRKVCPTYDFFSVRDPSDLRILKIYLLHHRQGTLL